jgi:hypothetical protein
LVKSVASEVPNSLYIAVPRRRPGPSCDIVRGSSAFVAAPKLGPGLRRGKRSGATPGAVVPLTMPCCPALQIPQTQKGPGIAARPRVAGLLPWIRTDLRHGFGGSSARAGKGMRASGRSSRLAVVRSSRRRAAVTSLGGPLRRSGRGPKLGSLAGCFSPGDPLHTFRNRLRGTSSGPILLAGRSLAPEAGACAPFPRTRFRPSSRPSRRGAALACYRRFPLSSRTCVPPLASTSSCACAPPSAVHFEQHLRATFRFSLRNAACAPRSASGRSEPWCPRCRRCACAPPWLRDFPGFRIPEPFPNAVSRRHQHRFRSV